MQTTALSCLAALTLLLAPARVGADDGDVLNSVGFQGVSAFAITLTPFDAIYVPELFGNTTYVHDLELNVTGFVASPANEIYGIAYVDPPGPAVASLYYLDGDGIIYVTDLGGIFLGSFELISPFGGALRGLTWDPDTNRMWTGDLTNEVYVEFFLDGEPTGNIFFAPDDAGASGITKVGNGSQCFDISLVAQPEPSTLARVLPNGVVQGSAPTAIGILPYAGIAWHPTGSTGAEVVYAVLPGGTSLHEVELGIPCAGSGSFVRGDCDGNGTYAPLVDAVHLLAFGFTGGPPPPCEKGADVDANGVVNPIVDGVYALNHGFNGGPPPPAPHPECGDDGSSLSCDDTSGCSP